ncbi:peptide chain release factor N(5)-glutamine methyltransferase [Dactylosporangium sp. CA-139066]|uniref:peptide chain release factor N(5)-glutamine methyltransferase n=1 Tax=Dactylosporangium sp. CA-139066 TaxID=3239930 RepID=UPI003D92FE4B
MHRLEDDTPERSLPTLSSVIAAAAAALDRAGVGSPRVDAELLAAHVLGVTRARLLTASAGREQIAEIRRLVARRAERIPLQHLTGTAPFYGLELAVGPGVFVPRFETELLVEWALARLGSAGRVVDLCSGSGAIALAVATQRPGLQVYCVERSKSALTWLRGNVERVAPRVRVIEADVSDDAVLADIAGTADMVLCNPPYVPETADVDVEVAQHDPHEAVFAGGDGLDLMPAVARAAARLLRPGGELAVEHDDTQGASLPDLLRATGDFDEIADHRDLAGRPRFATARRTGGTAWQDGSP